MASAGNSKPSQRVSQLSESLLSANNSALDVSGISELSANFGRSMNESFIQAVFSQEERVSTPKCVSKNPDYCESGDGVGLSDVDSDNDQSFVSPVESTPVTKRGRYQSHSPIRKKVVENKVL